MPDKEGRPVRGELGHFRYNKDMAQGNKFDKQGRLIATGPPIEPPKGKVTGTETPGLTEHGTPDPNAIHTRAIAKGFNKTEQGNLLKARGVSFRSRDSEAQLVAKILKSNPEGNENPKDEEPDAPPEPPGIPGPANVPYTEAVLEDFKSKKLIDILKNLGVKKMPLTEKGKIKKILETQ